VETRSWFDDLEESREVERKADKLLNVLARWPGERDGKREWLLANIPLMEAELEREGVDPGDTRRFAGGMKSLAIRWWRNEWKRRPRQVLESATPRSEERALTDDERAALKRTIAETRGRIRRIS